MRLCWPSYQNIKLYLETLWGKMAPSGITHRSQDTHKHQSQSKHRGAAASRLHPAQWLTLALLRILLLDTLATDPWDDCTLSCLTNAIRLYWIILFQQSELHWEKFHKAPVTQRRHCNTLNMDSLSGGHGNELDWEKPWSSPPKHGLISSHQRVSKSRQWSKPTLSHDKEAEVQRRGKVSTGNVVKNTRLQP